MLKVALRLPSTALVDQGKIALTRAIEESNGLWFSASQENLDIMEPQAAPYSWRATVGDKIMTRSKPNEGNGYFNGQALQLIERTHCGFVLEGAMQTADQFTVAIVWYSPTNNSRTLFSLMSGDYDNIIFLTEGDGLLIVKDLGGTVETSLGLPSLGKEARLAIVSLTSKGLMLEAFDKSKAVSGQAMNMKNYGSLFVGCRSNRPKLHKTLGNGQIRDVFLWPGKALLDRTTVESTEIIKRIHEYLRWEE